MLDCLGGWTIWSFLALFLSKYLRLVVNIYAYLALRPIPIPDNPTLTCQDVTIIIPTINGDGDDFWETVRGCLRADPFEVILVTIDANLQRVKEKAESLSKKRIRVLSVRQANKRRQMCRAIPEVTTAITVFADDDVIWPPQVLPWMLAPFEDPKMGGVGTRQSLRREPRPNIWNLLGTAYLIRRNWDCAACTYMDGGLPCLSGRTVAYRTDIVQDEEFTRGFTNETWRSYQLNADDDNFLTRWMVSHGYKTYFQNHRACEVQTTLEDNPKYLYQCLRWSRSNWRSNLKSMFHEGHVWMYVYVIFFAADRPSDSVTSFTCFWTQIANPVMERRRHPWSTFAVFQTTITSWAIIFDPLLCYLFWQVATEWRFSAEVWWTASGILWLWVIFLSRAVKYIEHVVRYPEDIPYLLLLPVFAYFHSVCIKSWAGLTMHVTAWGTREGADTDDSLRLRRLSYGTRRALSSEEKS